MFHYLPLYVKDKNVLPVMEEEDVFKLTIRYEKEETYRSEMISTPVNIKHANRILELIKENPKITVAEMAQKLSTSKSTVERALVKLSENGVIEREGSDKTGQWIIITD